jgi:hypothetical protein
MDNIVVYPVYDTFGTSAAEIWPGGPHIVDFDEFGIKRKGSMFPLLWYVDKNWYPYPNLWGENNILYDSFIDGYINLGDPVADLFLDGRDPYIDAYIYQIDAYIASFGDYTMTPTYSSPFRVIPTTPLTAGQGAFSDALKEYQENNGNTVTYRPSIGEWVTQMQLISYYGAPLAPAQHQHNRRAAALADKIVMLSSGQKLLLLTDLPGSYVNFYPLDIMNKPEAIYAVLSKLTPNQLTLFEIRVKYELQIKTNREKIEVEIEKRLELEKQELEKQKIEQLKSGLFGWLTYKIFHEPIFEF